MAWPTKLQRMMEGKDTVSGVAPPTVSTPATHAPAAHLPSLHNTAPLLPHMPNESTFPQHVKPVQPQRFQKLFIRK